ncbi:ATP-dependent RecD-like DNA helicase [Ktedonosporobacter rubrisoli]|uniref:ATP-dependent RecD2 DNA helicase n=1 Tax=Ktedonosporobacter rubrisoli TaxID=2509675 RepID=A0A4P6JTN1_KTERU|nr:ATP-dependent RecD-like DNA helicase [Ktedonosporobacter rubrisoli]QBD78266.1 ATP-dependent RecD-like DNA helicase [Ktedonosporobacter rubrisoli]
MPALEGSVENIVFRNEDNHYTVARFRPKDSGRLFRDDLTTLVGIMPGIRTGELLTVEGEWENDPRYGKQLRVTSFTQRLPASTEGIIRYLSSGLIKGIGPKKASLIVEHFGEQTLAIIEQQPERLREVKGIGAKDCNQIIKAWAEQSEIKELHLFLQSHDVSINVATRIYKQYGKESIKVIRANPYQLAQEVHGIGFRTADEIAVKLGLPPDSLPRLASGLKYVLTQAANEEGHCFLREADLMQRASEALKASPEILPHALDILRSEQDIFVEPPEAAATATLDDEWAAEEDSAEPTNLQARIYYGPFWYAESGSARLLRSLLNSPSSLPPAPQKLWDTVFVLLKQKRNMHLTEKQRAAVQMAYNNKVCILTGGPGTGKSTSIRALLMLLRNRKVDVALAAPTGRAAKRLAEATGVQAQTLHRLLEYAPHDNSYQRNEDRPLSHQFVIVDEFSMVDILLFYHLLKALPREAHLLLVGDADQLPSVGPGNVLHDLLAGEAIPTVRLTELFRQAQQSKIIVNAHRINAGAMPSTKIEANSDFFFMAEEDPMRAQQLILDLVQRRLPARYHFNPLTDIQVLAPMYKGPIGVTMLNECLQERLNPRAFAQVELGDHILRVGDKVMQTRNNYDKGVFNGDIGWIRSISRENATAKVEFVEETGSTFVSYDFNELDELTLAYAVTVHKSQGSEYPAIVLPLVLQHRMLLQRNLLYTAITRAKRFCVLVGQPQALEIAVRNARIAQRNTALAERLLAWSKGSAQTLV